MFSEQEINQLEEITLLPHLKTDSLSPLIKENLGKTSLSKRLAEYADMQLSIQMIIRHREDGVPQVDLEQMIEDFYLEGYNETTYVDPENGLYRFGPKQKVIVTAFTELKNHDPNVLTYIDKFTDINQQIWTSLPVFYSLHSNETRIETPVNYESQTPYPEESVIF